MQFRDNIDCYGIFNFKSVDADDNVLEEYTEKNLIMDTARSNMARLIGGVDTGSGGDIGYTINRFVLGTRGHVGTNILLHQKVGEADESKPVGDQTFDSTREALFSETIGSDVNYHVDFTPTGDLEETFSGDGVRYEGTTAVGTTETGNTIHRLVTDRTVTYTITIPVENGNSGDQVDPVVPYTEAALYAGTEIFAMKTFPARVKENSVKFIVEWSIIF